MKSKSQTVVLGAGIAGLSAAWHLQKKGIPCRVLEKESEVGGLCRSRRLRGFVFDCSGHLLHFKHDYTFKFIQRLLGKNLIRHERNAWIYFDGRYIRSPFQANLFGLSDEIIQECIMGFKKAKKKDDGAKNGNFLEWINRTFGKGIARHFLIPYNEKFWTIPPQELTCEWVDGMVPVPSLKQVVEGAMHESAKPLGYNAKFWYPREGGIDRVAKAIAKNIKSIQTENVVTKIDLASKKLTLASGRTLHFDHLVSTMPLPVMGSIVSGLPREVKLALGKLRWNSVLNLNLGIQAKSHFPLSQHWIYFPKKEPCFFRVGFFHNFSSSLVPVNGRSLYAEVSYSRHKPIKKKEMMGRMVSHLKKAGILSACDKICARDINDIKYAYPIYDRNYRSSLEKIRKFFKGKGIELCGRYGSWRYMSMEDAILDGKRAAESIAKKGRK